MRMLWRRARSAVPSNHRRQASSSGSRRLGESESLIPSTLRSLHQQQEEEEAVTVGDDKTVARSRPGLEERKSRRRDLSGLDIPEFSSYLKSQGLALRRAQTKILQLNIGLYCNQACSHCHVEASPKRKEHMSQEVIDKCFDFVDKSPAIKTIDITGGAPELNPGFREIVERASARGLEVIDRCNLTVLMEPGQEDLPKFLADHKVRVCASLPCYSERNVNMQRGSKVFQRSIKGLKLLNNEGYGHEDSGLFLDLVYNPNGPFLPPNQSLLEVEYKNRLNSDFGITFNGLLTITNMPIKRFADMLYRTGKLEEYLNLLVNSFNVQVVSGLMCRETLSVGWDGSLFDCDFNQQLNLGIGEGNYNNKNPKSTLSIFDFDSSDKLFQHDIKVGQHCFGCTAGAGSSCQGATVV